MPASCGLPPTLLVAPTMRELGPVAAAWIKGSSNEKTFVAALDEAAVSCVILCVRDPADLAWRIDRDNAERIVMRHRDEPTETSIPRQAMKLARLIDMDEFERKAAEVVKRPRRKKAGAEEAEVPEDISPMRSSSRAA